MKISKIIKKAKHITGFNGTVVVADNTVDMYKKCIKLSNERYNWSFLMRQSAGLVTRKEFNDCSMASNDYINILGLSKLRLLDIERLHKYESFVGGLYHHNDKYIVINKNLEKVSKKRIKYVILHEIGHHFKGYSEADADKFAEEWIDKL